MTPNEMHMTWPGIILRAILIVAAVFVLATLSGESFLRP